MPSVIAIDPGTNESGVAFFNCGELISLEMMNLPAIVEMIRSSSAHFVVEDVEANKFIYSRNEKQSKRVGLQVAQGVGQVKATAHHIITFIEHYERALTKIPPTSGNWGTIRPTYGKAALKQRLGWDSSSNKDTRSAAFFGWLYHQRYVRG